MLSKEGHPLPLCYRIDRYYIMVKKMHVGEFLPSVPSVEEATPERAFLLIFKRMFGVAGVDVYLFCAAFDAPPRNRGGLSFRGDRTPIDRSIDLLVRSFKQRVMFAFCLDVQYLSD